MILIKFTTRHQIPNIHWPDTQHYSILYRYFSSWKSSSYYNSVGICAPSIPQYHRSIHIMYRIRWIAVTFRCNQLKQYPSINIIDCVLASTIFIFDDQLFFLFFILGLRWPFAIYVLWTRCSSILSNLRIIIIILWQYFTQTQLKLSWYRSELAQTARYIELCCKWTTRRDIFGNYEHTHTHTTF